MADFSHILLATDLDGTFFGRGASLLEKNLDAVEYFKANGGHVMAATGRVCSNLLRVVPHAAEVFNTPSVTSNGAYICNFATGEVLDRTPMNAAATKRLVLELESFDPNVAMRVSDDRGFLVNGDRINEMMQREIDSPHFVGDVIPARLWDDQNASWYKMVLRGDHETLCRVRDTVYPAYADCFEFSASAPTLFEMQAKGCTKATGISFVAKYMEARLGRPLTVVAVGDQENDIPMLAAAHLSACPDNALAAVKELAKIHLCHHTEGAVAELIAYLDEQGS